MSRPLIHLVLAIVTSSVIANALALQLVPFTVDTVELSKAAVFSASLLGIALFAQWRWAGEGSAFTGKIRYIGRSIYLLGITGAVMGAASTSMLVGNYLMMSADFPLQDDLFAALDQSIGFDWIALLGWTNERPLLAWVLVTAYSSSLIQVNAVILYFAAMQRAERLLEFTALYVLTATLVCIISMLLPALGAYEVYQPDPALHSNMTNLGYVHLETLLALRDGSFAHLDFANVVGMVSFPSFHTVLALIVTYAFRRTWLFWPVLVLNALVIFSTLPQGGHFLVDLFGGAGVTLFSILLVRSLRGGYREAGGVAAGEQVA